MSFKTILVCLNHEATTERLTNAACLLARRFDAHLIGLHAAPSVPIYPGVAIPVTSQVVAVFEEAQKKHSENIRQTFEQVTRAESFVSEWREIRTDSIDSGSSLTEQARCADLVVMPQADADTDHSDQTHLLREVIEGCGRPVLVIPKIGTHETIGQHVLIGWSATREATRAVHDAIPFMENGGAADILWVSHGKKDVSFIAETAADTAACLDRHGVKATVSHWEHAEISIGDALLNEAFERGADLIVTGAFGHSRFYDFVIGATTSHLLEHMTVPVLFSR
jgi:nucleotide-binding universal stress UspA family protein